MQLSLHFSLEEMTVSEVAARKAIDNTPPAGVVDTLRKTAAGLEVVRGILGHALHITSGYRCPQLNAAIGGAPNSAHCPGWAADFICPKAGAPFWAARAIAAHVPALKFDQLILEYSWVHIAFAPAMRGELLTRRSAAAPYEPGLNP